MTLHSTTSDMIQYTRPVQDDGSEGGSATGGLRSAASTIKNKISS